MKKGKRISKKIRVELHTHTSYSYDCDNALVSILEKLHKSNIDILGVADHNQIEGALRLAKLAPSKTLVGEEILTTEGEVIGFFLNKFIPPGQSMKETIKHIKKQGGVVYLPHPFDKTTRKTAVREDFIEQIIKDVDVVEVHNGRSVYDADNKKALAFAKKHKKLIACGSDAHTTFEFGRNYLVMDEFNTAKEFLHSLASAKLHTKKVMPWVFLLTKLVRFQKRNFTATNIKSLPAGFSCDLCGSDKYRVVYKKKGRAKSHYFISDDSYGVHPQIVTCLDCGLTYCYPRESEKKIVDRYTKFVDETYEKERFARKQNQTKVIINLERLLKRKGRLLDVGAATGTLMEAAQDRRWKVFGIEPSRWAVAYAKAKYKLAITRGTIETAKLKTNSFDAISLVDVIEHVDSPRDLLTSVWNMLVKDGIVVVVTPNKASVLARLMGEKWWHVRPDHIYYFDFTRLKLLAESIGFSIVDVKTAGWNFSYDYWISRFKNNNPFIYNILSNLKNIHFLSFMTKRNYDINFGDSLEIYLKKDEK